MGQPFDHTPRDVPRVATLYRRIVSQIPHPLTVPTVEKLHRYEPRSMQGQPPVVWDRAEGVQVWDGHGNMWLDFSSGVLVTNAGHAHPQVRQAIEQQVRGDLLHSYCFPNRPRAELVEYLIKLAPERLDKCFLLTTGSETTECALKLARTWGQQQGGPGKIGIVAFENAFHGRTMGAQQMGTLGGGADWIVNRDPDIHHVPFPDGYRVEDTRFEVFLETLERLGVGPERIAGVITETYQGVGPDFLPVEYAQRLSAWCKQHDVVMIYDEVQAGFGRTGKQWGFEHYGVVPDLFTCGKGIASSLPLGCVIGRPEIMDQYAPGSMTSTHSGNPVCCAAALASARAIAEEGMIENSARLEGVLMPALREMQSRHPARIGRVHGKGLVGGLQFVLPGTKTPDPDAAHQIVERCYQRGLLLFAPVGVGGGCIKLNPPLCITEDALRDGLGALGAAVDAALADR